jgi:hypothetical protein
VRQRSKQILLGVRRSEDKSIEEVGWAGETKKQKNIVGELFTLAQNALLRGHQMVNVLHLKQPARFPLHS